ncbi:MAG: cyclic nucleotide-binding domain-containing protein [Polyangiaceae bacterium]|nr:cyclic nucleotide-binding domain-containing protein [Myxococcales bacterium]MCB9584752.1 cyclic nucleotide-binding domain-containing protein [Polyangiaceae bacterium]MCB9607675.1 cyclic nucleotide-binding domain-containing protein [Polyangiaceae bacterium]
MENLERVVKAHPFAADLPQEHLSVLACCARNVRRPTGEFLFKEGNEAGRFYLIRKGRVALEVHVPGRGAIQVESVGAGGVLGFSWLFPEHRWTLDARAMESVVALEFDATCLLPKMDQDPALGYALIKPLTRELYKRLSRVRLSRLDVYGDGKAGAP